jgi:RimJ/RimL family protein N-acetyltransferase
MLTAIRTSFAELQRWMSWAQKMPTTDALRQVLMQGQLDFDANLAWEYTVIGAESEQLVGGVGLHLSDRPDRFEIGYWVRSDRTGRGIATAATGALVEATFTYLSEATHIAIRMDHANLSSAAIPHKLGFALNSEEDRDILAIGHTGRGYVWILDRNG